MRPGVIRTSVDSVRSVSVLIYRGEKLKDIISGNPEPFLDLTEFCTSVQTTENSCTIKLSFDAQLLNCEVQPKPEDAILINVDGYKRSLTVLEGIYDFVESRGTRSMTLKGRSRDGFDGWRSVYATTPVFPLGSNYLAMMETICEVLLALEQGDHAFLPISLSVPHSNVQFSDMSPWAMLEEIALAASMEVFTDVLGVVRSYSIDTLRVHDLFVENSRVVEFGVARQLSKSGTSSAKIEWLDPDLKRQYQVDQVLGSEVITAGFFKLKVVKEVWFSSDKTQRADNTYLKIIDSANNGILGLSPVDEDYKHKDDYHGEIILKTNFWYPTLYTIALGVLLTTSAEADLVQTDPLSGSGFTIPVGRIAHGAALVVMLATMMAIGTGSYEVWGQPYDYVHAKNYTVVRDCGSSYRSLNQSEFSSNLIISEEHAKDAMIKRLTFLNASNYELSVTLIDDARIEKGDILLFEDGTRMMVNTFSNDFSRGSKAHIRIGGMLI